MNPHPSFKILGLSPKEERVFLALQSHRRTVADIAILAKVSRPSVYDILKKLKKRGLASSSTHQSKTLWHTTAAQELSESLYDLKKSLLQFADGKEEVRGLTDGMVTVHRGTEAVRSAIYAIFVSKHARILGYAGSSQYAENWSTLFSQEELRRINTYIKKSGTVMDVVLPKNYAESSFKQFGKEWAKGYEGRTTSTVVADTKYFSNAGEMYAFKDTLYLVALRDKIILEIKHSDIQKMVLALFEFMKDHGEKVDINQVLRDFIEKEEDTMN